MRQDPAAIIAAVKEKIEKPEVRRERTESLRVGRMAAHLQSLHEALGGPP